MLWQSIFFICNNDAAHDLDFFIEKVRANTRLIPVKYYIHETERKYQCVHRYERITHPDLTFVSVNFNAHQMQYFCSTYHDGTLWYLEMPNRLSGGARICMGTEEEALHARFQKLEHPRLAHTFFQSDFTIHLGKGEEIEFPYRWRTWRRQEPESESFSLLSKMLTCSEAFRDALAAA